MIGFLAGLGSMQTLAWSAVIGAVAVAGVGTERYFAGKREGARLDKQRSDLVIEKLQTEHMAKVMEANQRAVKIGADWLAVIEGKERVQELERERNRIALASVVRGRDKLRDQLASAATGGLKESDDTVAACRSRADAIGVVLGEVLYDYAVCTAEAEDLASGVRTLRSSWPSNPGVESIEVKQPEGETP